MDASRGPVYSNLIILMTHKAGEKTASVELLAIRGAHCKWSINWRGTFLGIAPHRFQTHRGRISWFDALARKRFSDQAYFDSVILDPLVSDVIRYTWSALPCSFHPQVSPTHIFIFFTFQFVGCTKGPVVMDPRKQTEPLIILNFLQYVLLAEISFV